MKALLSKTILALTSKLICLSSKKLPLSTLFHIKKKKRAKTLELKIVAKKVTRGETTPPQYNLRPLFPQVEEQKGNKTPPVAWRRPARHQPHRQKKTESLEQLIDTLTKLLNTLVVSLGQNAANVTPAIPPGIPLANAEGEEIPPLQKARDVTASEA